MLRAPLEQLFGYDIDMAPTRNMAFFLYTDRPGMIGKVGTILGEAGINIATMQVGRTDAGGQALMCLAVDSALDHALLERIKAEAEMDNAWNVTL